MHWMGRSTQCLKVQRRCSGLIRRRRRSPFWAAPSMGATNGTEDCWAAMAPSMVRLAAWGPCTSAFSRLTAERQPFRCPHRGLTALQSATYRPFAGIPQNADSVLRIDPATLEVSTLGTLPSGGWKWHGGVVSPDGVIYSLPAHADSVLRIDPRTRAISEIGGPLKTGKHRSDGKYKYLGGVLGKDGRIYGIPSDADYVLCIDPKTQASREGHCRPSIPVLYLESRGWARLTSNGWR